MRRLAKNASTWGLTALFGCISLFGPGWHCFVGHPFHASPECQEHHHAARGDSPDGHDTDHGTRAAAHADDCPICRFFAQAQWASALPAAELDLPAFAAAPAGERCATLVRIAPYRSRAPPRGRHFS